jgi:hypothetical protein
MAEKLNTVGVSAPDMPVGTRGAAGANAEAFVARLPDEWGRDRPLDACRFAYTW